MSHKFNADEIFEVAEQIERNGAKFYRKAAQIFKEEEYKGLLNDLAAMEDDHEKIFMKMRGQISEAFKEPTVFDPDEQMKMYLQAFADGKVFDTKKDPSELLSGNETLSDIINKAIGLEKDSIVFYSGMKQMVPPEWGRENLDRIIGEEIRHIGILNNIMGRFGKK